MANLQLTKNLYNYREARGYTQERVGRYLNITRQAYSNYETGKRDPDLDLLVKLSQLYGITLDQLVLDSFSAGMIRETRPPYIAAEAKNHGTLFLSREEANLVMKYRTASDEDRYMTAKILDLKQPKKRS